MDTKIVNRGVYGEANAWPDTPRIERVFLRDLSGLSYGNAVGVGMADAIHDRLLRKIDWTPTYINSLTGASSTGAKTPMHFPSDRECLEKMSRLVGKVDPAEVTIGWIPNTLELGLVALSENLKDSLAANGAVELLGPAWDFPFDGDGDLRNLLTHPALAGLGSP